MLFSLAFLCTISMSLKGISKVQHGGTGGWNPGNSDPTPPRRSKKSLLEPKRETKIPRSHSHSIHGTGIFAYMKTIFYHFSDNRSWIGKYASLMDDMGFHDGNFGFGFHVHHDIFMTLPIEFVDFSCCEFFETPCLDWCRNAWIHLGYWNWKSSIFVNLGGGFKKKRFSSWPLEEWSNLTVVCFGGLTDPKDGSWSPCLLGSKMPFEITQGPRVKSISTVSSHGRFCF